MKKILFILIAFLTFNAYAANDCQDGEQNCWDCGKTSADLCTARLNGTELSITGTGDMKDYTLEGRHDDAISDVPWGQDITKVTIEGNQKDDNGNIIRSGIQYIGRNAFIGATDLTDVSIPDSVTTIGWQAFYHTGITDLVLPDSITTIEHYAFQRCYDLKGLVIPETLTSMGDIMFENTPATIYCPQPPEGQTSPCADKGAANLQYYTKDENNFYQTTDGKLFASLDLMAAGAACTDAKNCQEILNSNGQPFKVGSKIYNSIQDFANGNYVKHRIYTIDEANRIAGDKNRVSIKYR